MSRWPPLILLAVTLAATWAIVASSEGLPGTVASSFGAYGAPRAWMTRDTYVLWMVAFAAGIPWIVFGAIALAPRLWPRLTSLPYKEFWLAPPRREASLAFLAAHGCALGCLLALFGYGVHTLVAMANAATPPRLPTAPFLALVGAFLACMGIWMLLVYRRFRRPPGKL